MYYGEIKNCDIANGPGVRVSLFVSGCTRGCKDCFNRETWSFIYGQPFTQDTIDRILSWLAPEYITGLTVLGGEPFEPQNQPEVLRLLRQVRKTYPEKSIWCFTGYTLDEHILAKKLGAWEVTEELLTHLDVLVDGPFVAERKNLRLRFRGSENQRLIDMKKTLATGEIVLWEDWQSEGGAKE
ncbi:MAG: anaerobic ribonucleoside-triphosphate reductase activating protein [Ruminococcaceae bacterium]|nr:anaerobic ribonucleoside-triphosphate reductase activating protein [Oscillospiraceae bacterium]